MKDNETFSYFISAKNSTVVVSMIGPLYRSNIHLLEACLQEVLDRKADFVILSLRDVPPNVDQAVLPTLTRMQKVLRETSKELRLASIHPELRGRLEKLGLLRAHEVMNNLAEALQDLYKYQAKAA